ncbi:hypothetical protein AK812_SmicGene18778 [Symbiodinium microadriaticum]|uniref:Uncharacterized protein n=1 Tax=Symbiodinium microadriaticum TaxID=2951 RepID=A0A1Q9DUC3_SYMMI|nr:hypothetical protein AK812_SmicGene18778 [Symbiodinium microadriaticum]
MAYSRRTCKMDVLKAADSNPRNGVTCPSDVERFDIIVCSDCLYKHDVARAIAVLIGRALLAYPTTMVVVTDANRRGRQVIFYACNLTSFRAKTLL